MTTSGRGSTRTRNPAGSASNTIVRPRTAVVRRHEAAPPGEEPTTCGGGWGAPHRARTLRRLFCETRVDEPGRQQSLGQKPGHERRPARTVRADDGDAHPPRRQHRPQGTAQPVQTADQRPGSMGHGMPGAGPPGEHPAERDECGPLPGTRTPDDAVDVPARGAYVGDHLRERTRRRRPRAESDEAIGVMVLHRPLVDDHVQQQRPEGVVRVQHPHPRQVRRPLPARQDGPCRAGPQRGSEPVQREVQLRPEVQVPLDVELDPPARRAVIADEEAMGSRSHLRYGDDAERPQRLLDRAQPPRTVDEDVDVAPRVAEVVLAAQERPRHVGGLERLGGPGHQRVQAVATMRVAGKPPGADRRVDVHLLSHDSVCGLPPGGSPYTTR